IPVGELKGGYYTLSGSLTEDNEVRTGGTVFCIRQLREGSPRQMKFTREDYLTFVSDAIRLMSVQQSARLGNEAGAPLFFTVTRPVYRSYRSIGFKRDDGTFENYWFPEAPMDHHPVVVDFELWTLLDRLSAQTGEEQYRAWVDDMANAFAKVGFSEQNGLAYFGEESGLDVTNIKPISTKHGVSDPQFKPKNSGNDARLPMDRLWRHAPDRMLRMNRAMFYGLVTDPGSMDFNRYCHYHWNDADKKHVLERNPAHCAFESVAARMIHWWAAAYARSGAVECLDYAQRMTDKWRAVQHPESGLMPNFFGAVASQPGAPMPPGEWAECRNASAAAVSFLDAAAELEAREDGASLKRQLTEMAEKLALGVARYSYDPATRVFREHLQLDGQPYNATARYAFRTQEEKDEAVKRDPILAEVTVYSGTGLYRNPSYWEHCAGTSIVYELAQVARLTKNAELIDRTARIIEDALDESSSQQDAFTDEGTWTFRASGQYAKACVALFRATGDRVYLEKAKKFADREIARLERVAYPEWWRMPERATLLDALLAIAEAEATATSATS
ncbi:MAG TPA: hypothetical protein PLJ47_09355, partial [Candidatus Hydrogenedentes bacterium]|nr:hypothetical protein [Candidatus Hydrogenedentota bacterium]